MAALDYGPLATQSHTAGQTAPRWASSDPQALRSDFHPPHRTGEKLLLAKMFKDMMLEIC